MPYPPGTDLRITSEPIVVTCGCCDGQTSLVRQHDHAVGPHGYALDDPYCRHCGAEFTDEELEGADPDDFDPRDEPGYDD